MLVRLMVLAQPAGGNTSARSGLRLAVVADHGDLIGPDHPDIAGIGVRLEGRDGGSAREQHRRRHLSYGVARHPAALRVQVRRAGLGNSDIDAVAGRRISPSTNRRRRPASPATRLLLFGRKVKEKLAASP